MRLDAGESVRQQAAMNQREPAAASHRDRRLALGVALLAFVIYNANFRDISVGDTLPARFLPLALLHYGTLYLDPLYDAARWNRDHPYWLARSGGHWLSGYPVVTPILVAPFYLPAVAYLDHSGRWNEVRVVQVLAELSDKLAASSVAAICAGLMFWLLRSRLPGLSRARALALTAAFALGTETWAISSQALWQHGTAEMLMLLALLAVTREPTPAALLLAGSAAGLVIVNRPFDALLAAAFAAYVLLRVRPLRRVPWFLVPAGVLIALVVAYHLAVFGNLGGGYELTIRKAPPALRNFPLWPGIAGQLVSPGKGLFFYCPFLLFLLFHYRRALAEPYRLLAICLTVGAATLPLIYAKTDWTGGWSYGPRYSTDMLPILVWLLAPVVASLGSRGFALFATATLFAIYVQAVGAFCYPRGQSDAWTGQMMVWNPAKAPFVAEARGGLAHPFLLDMLRGRPGALRTPAWPPL
jgi:hypothetical protein